MDFESKPPELFPALVRTNLYPHYGWLYSLNRFQHISNLLDELEFTNKAKCGESVMVKVERTRLQWNFIPVFDEILSLEALPEPRDQQRMLEWDGVIA